MRIGLLSTWASRLGGGVFEAVVNHGRMLADLGHEPSLFALEDRHSAEDCVRFAGKVHIFEVLGPRAVGYAPRLAAALNGSKLDALHLHGIWMYPSMAGAGWASRTRRPYVISPHGMLDPWIVARGRLKKAIARLGYERRSWAAATMFHALTAAESGDIARETGNKSVTVIANSVSLPPITLPAERPKRILALGRVHPKKNLDGLARGWAASSAPATGWELVIAGWGEPGDIVEFEALLSELAPPSIRFVGPAFGSAKAALFADARFFILPSFSEGLPLAILEAWASGLPTIQSAGCNLPEGFKRGAAIETGTNPADISAAIDRAIALPANGYSAMAGAARALVERHFSHDAIGRQWDDLYKHVAAAAR